MLTFYAYVYLSILQSIDSHIVLKKVFFSVPSRPRHDLEVATAERLGTRAESILRYGILRYVIGME